MMRSLILLLAAISFASCESNYVSSIPDYPVYMELNLASTYPNFRDNPNQYLVFKQPVNANERVGYGGLLIYCKLIPDDKPYSAFDLACPYEVDHTIKVVPNDMGQAVCPECGTIYDISAGIGNPTEGPAKETLRRYKANLQGDILYITR